MANMKKQNRLFNVLTITMLVICSGICPVYAADYYVSPTGNDSDSGSLANPFATIGKAVSTVSAGDTIYLRGGQHNYSSTVSISKSGTSGNLITLQAYQDEVPVIDFTATGTGTRGIDLGGSYWHFYDFIIQYAGDNGLYIDGTNNTVELITARWNEDSGIQLHTGAADNLILNCDSYENYDPGNHGENADGFATKFGLGTGNILRGCRSWSNSDDGYDCWNTTPPSEAVTFDHCWAFRNGINTWGDTAFAGDGNGFKLGAGVGAHLLINCVAYENPHHGIDINGNTEGVTVYNCTCVGNGGTNFYFDEPSSANVLRNNVSHLGSVNIYPEIDDAYNSWNGFTLDDTDFVSLDSTGIDGPRESDGSLPSLSFLRPSTGSALIDAGIDVGLPYEGAAPDLGAYEYTGTDFPPAAPTGLAATAGEGTITLDWNDNSESDLDGYNVYRSTTSGSGYVKQNGSLLSTSDYTDNSVTNNTTYYYVVTAVDVNSNESGYSIEDSATPGDFTPPAVPAGVTAAADDKIVWVEWDDNSESDLAGYNIYRSITSGSGYVKLNSVLLTSPDYNDSIVANTITYYYVVTAVDTSSNESAYSSEVSATPAVYGDFIINGTVDEEDLDYLVGLWLENDCGLSGTVDLDDNCIVNLYEFSAFALNWLIMEDDVTPPTAPTGLAATAGDGTVSLDWNDNTEGDLSYYNIYRSTTSGSYGAALATSLTQSAFTDNTVSNGTTYYYVVTAVDTSTNESDNSNQDSATPESPITSITIQEDETGYCGVDDGGSVDNNNAGFTGTGFVNTENAVGEGINWSVNISTAGTYIFEWRYANSGNDRPGNLIINSTTEVSGISFPGTGSWTTWDTTTAVEVTLTAGVKDIRLEATSSSGLANIDYIMISGANPQAASCP